MRILALETDIEKIKKRFLCEGEKEVLTTHYHGASFLFASIREFFFTMLLFGIGVAAWFMNAPMGYTVAMLFVVWFVVRRLKMGVSRILKMINRYSNV